MSTESEKTSQTISSTASTNARITKCVRRGMFISLTLFLALVTLALCLGIPAAYDYDKHQGGIVKSIEPAGQVMAVTLTDGLLPGALVETDTGFYALTQGVSLPKDKPLAPTRIATCVMPASAVRSCWVHGDVPSRLKA